MLPSSRIGFYAALAVLAAAPARMALAQSSGPRVYYSDLESGPNTGGENGRGAYVTIYGKNFGATRGASFVKIGGGQAAAYPLWTDSKIAFQLGSAAATGNLVVTTPAGASNSIPFTVRPGNIYFVSPGGNDNGKGSFSSPWRTLPHAAETIKAGDIIYAMDGVSQTVDDGQGWDAALVLRADWCTASGYPRAMLAYPGATVVIGNPNGNKPASGLRTTDFSAGGGPCGGNWVFGGLQFRGSAPVSVSGPSSQWRFVGNDISCPNSDGSGGGGACFGTSLASNVKFYGNNVHDAGAANASALFQGVYFSTDSNHIDMGWNTVANVKGCRGVQIHSSPLGTNYPNSGYPQYDIAIHDNLIHDTQCDGIIADTIDPSKGPVSIYNNVIYNGGKGPNNPEHSGGWSCINVPANTESGPAGSGTVDIYNNTLYACGTFTSPPYGNANSAIAYGGGNRNLYLRIRNNLISQVATSLDPSGVPYLVIWNPTIPNGGGVCADTDNCPWIQGSNNLFFGSGPTPVNSNIRASMNANPMFVNAAQHDFHLQVGSPAHGKGIDTGSQADFDGNLRGGNAGFDIGAYQLVAAGVSSLTCVPSQVVTPGATTCSLSLSADAPPGGAVVTLTSDNADVVPPGSITVAAGSTTAAGTASVSPVAARASATITASSGGTSQTFALTLAPPGDPGPLVFGAFNSASYLAGPVSPGEVVTIFGSNLGPETPSSAASDARSLPTLLGGTKALFNGVAGQLFYVQSSQLNVVVPQDVAGKTAVSLVIQAGAAQSAPLVLAVQPTAPGLFTADASGRGQAVALNADGGLNSPANPAAQGSVIRLFATGAGSPVAVDIGGLPADVQQAPGFEGIFSIDAIVPDTAPSGAAVPLMLLAGNAASQGAVTLAVR